MHWRKRDIWKIGIAIAGILPFLLVMAWIPVSVASAHKGALGLARSGTVQATSTVDVTAVAQDLLKQQDDKLRRDNSFPWTLLNAIGGAGIGGIGTIFLAIAAFVTARNGLKQWQGNRVDEQTKRDKEQERWQKEQEEVRRKRDEERFQNVVTGLGSEREDAKIGAAILLRTYLRPGYEQFFRQAFDLACAYLLLRKAPPNADLNVPIPLDPLSEALIIVFRESFPYVRDSFSEEERSQYPPPYFNATSIQLDNAFLSYIDLREVWLREAYLRRANLWAADLRKANLKRARLAQANLSRAKLEGADLSLSDLSEAKLEGADPEAARYLNGTIMHDVTGLTKEQLESCKAKGAIIDEDPTTSSSQSTVASTLSPQSNDGQASSTLSAQGSLSTPDKDGSGTTSSTNP